MKISVVIFLLFIFCKDIPARAAPADPVFRDTLENFSTEPCTYSCNFEDRLLGAWASYPHWQDLAYDQNFRIDEMVAGDPNISLVQKITPYSHVDNYAGAQKLLDMYLTPGSKISFRYFIKSSLSAEYIKVRFAAGALGKLDVTLQHPGVNGWVWATVTYEDFVCENPQMKNKKQVRIYALAFLLKIALADPAMPVYLGLDDITLKGARATNFQFAEPAMYKLPEFAPYIPQKPYSRNELFNLRGSWPLNAKKVVLQIRSYVDTTKILYAGVLARKDGSWTLRPLKLDFPEGLYLGKLSAYDEKQWLSETEFTIHVAPKGLRGVHPRLLFNSDKKKWMDDRFKEERFRKLYDEMVADAASQREKIPVKSLVYDLDQFPDENWLPTWEAWGSHILNTSDALWWNSLAYTFHGDSAAGNYVKEVLVTLAGWPDWTSPWQTKRGRFGEHRTGAWSHRLALAYDLCYGLMSPDERVKVRKAIMKNIVEGVHRTFVYDDNITGKTSNWIAMTVGGSLMNMAAMYEDGEETEHLEPYFTGALMKYYAFINAVTGGAEGGWGEGLGYNNYSFANMSLNVPSLKNVFNIDVTGPLQHSYAEYIWSGIIEDKQYFNFGDAAMPLGSVSNWAFLLNSRKEPRLSWYYNYLKDGETFADVLYDLKDIAQDTPFDENPDKVFPKIGTTVFKSGWGKNDFSFAMRTGAFFNHQHLDQGSFWLSDRGVNFIGERKGSAYYDDPLYQPWFIQPAAHSTILVNGNHQSQRTGDGYHFAPGFNDNAFISQFLDGKEAAFSSGDIGRLYWGKVKELRRNVVFIKPRTLLMLDEAVPGPADADIALLYQVSRLRDITAGEKMSAITKQGATLHIMHLAPAHVQAAAVETPHYLNTLLKIRPLEKEGMLTVTARTKGDPLIIANLLTTTDSGAAPAVRSMDHGDYVDGIVSGKHFAFTKIPGRIYRAEDAETDALAVVWDDSVVLVANGTLFNMSGYPPVRSDHPASFELSAEGIRYFRKEAGRFFIGVKSRPSRVMLNDKQTNDYTYDDRQKAVVIIAPQGEGWISVR